MHATMPRTTRLDTPGLLHHIMIRGIEHRKIFNDVMSLIFLKTDVAKYFDSIDHDILLNLVEKKVKDIKQENLQRMENWANDRTGETTWT